jgi:5-methylcytosine-specific restriction endonuclease McrA
MKKHTKIYLKEMGFDTTDFIPCELCGKQANDLHHIEARGMGGSNTKDTIENLMALCRECHIETGDKKQYKGLLKATHIAYMRRFKK